MNTTLTNTQSPIQTYSHFILGGARSGKSSYAEKKSTELATQNSLPLVYLATASAGDDEMGERIKRHQQDRHAGWSLVEEQVDLANALNAIKPRSVVLLDCLTLWLSNCLHQSDTRWQQQKQRFIEVIKDNHHCLVMVSNEVGHGIIPMGKLTRQYVDEIGWLHQEIAQLAHEVTMVIAGLPQKLK